MLRIEKARCKYDLCKYYFTERIVNIWNSLPNHVVLADSTTIVKSSRLDNHWKNQEVINNFQSEIAGTGSRSEISSNL